MRYGLLVVGSILCIGLGLGWLAWEHATSAALDEEAQLAIEVGCRGHQGQAARDCRDMRRRLYLAGSLDPDKALRAYCREMKTAGWGDGPSEPPEICVKRYAGGGG